MVEEGERRRWRQTLAGRGCWVERRVEGADDGDGRAGSVPLGLRGHRGRLVLDELGEMDGVKGGPEVVWQWRISGGQTLQVMMVRRREVRRQRETREGRPRRGTQGVQCRRSSVDHGLSGTLRFPPGSVLVIRVLLHVHGPQPLRFVNERSLLHLRQKLPLGTQPLGDLRVVHLRVVQSYLPALYPRPDHERVHRTLDVLLTLGVHAWRHREARVTVTVRTRHADFCSGRWRALN